MRPSWRVNVHITTNSITFFIYVWRKNKNVSETLLYEY
nr:MAG TPA: hypothetical protein [Caudoviricetes sp.]